jgi:Dissimilatory sulfite reductase (desulfoviridin), gamma subunit
MPIFEYQGLKIEVDEDGFMQKPEEWSEDVARALATTEDIKEMTEAHWKLFAICVIII